MITKSNEVGNFKDVVVLHISKIDVRTKIVGNESEIAICNDPNGTNKTPKDGSLLGVDMLIVGDAKGLRWLGELLLDQADKTPINRTGYCAVIKESPKAEKKEDNHPQGPPPLMVYNNCTSCSKPLKKPITARLGEDVLCETCIEKEPVLTTCDDCGTTLREQGENFIGTKPHCESCYNEYPHITHINKSNKE